MPTTSTRAFPSLTTTSLSQLKLIVSTTTLGHVLAWTKMRPLLSFSDVLYRGPCVFFNRVTGISITSSVWLRCMWFCSVWRLVQILTISMWLSATSWYQAGRSPKGVWWVLKYFRSKLAHFFYERPNFTYYVCPLGSLAEVARFHTSFKLDDAAPPGAAQVLVSYMKISIAD